MNDTAIDFQALRYQTADFSLELNRTIDSGTITALAGPSGAGKSTLLNLIAGFLAPDSGQIISQGKSISDLPPAKRPVTTLFQEHNLFPHLRVWDNIALGINPTLKLTPQEQEQIVETLTQIGLSGFASRYPDQLSGGQRQRVAIARCLVRKRPLLLLDEPFSALDPALRLEMLDLIASIRHKHNITVIMVTYFPDDAARIADTLWLLEKGKLVENGATDHLLSQPGPALASYLGLPGRMHG